MEKGVPDVKDVPHGFCKKASASLLVVSRTCSQ